MVADVAINRKGRPKVYESSMRWNLSAGNFVLA
jgi:hypothetical protein